MSKEPWYSDEGSFWKARSIFQRCMGLDVLPDRGGFTKGERTPARLAFVKSVIECSAFDDWLRSQTPDSSEVYAVDEGDMHLRATNNRSFGYTYLWAWQDPETRKKGVKSVGSS